MSHRGPYIIIHGNPVDGLQFIGPFPDAPSAAAWGNQDGDLDGDWWVAALYAPEEK